MDTARYRAFMLSAENGSFTRAAELLGYTPSGVSQLVAALEKELGFALLLRGKKGVRLSENGTLLLPVVREIVAQEDRLHQTAAKVMGMAIGSVTIGTYPSVAAHWLPSLVKEFQNKYPNIQINIMEGIRPELTSWLDERRIDLAFISYQEPMLHEWLPIRDDPMVAILPRSHPLANAAAYPLANCPNERFLMPALGDDDDVTEMFKRNGITPNITISTLMSYTVIAMVEKDMGMSIMNSLVTKNWVCDAALLPLDPPEHITLGITLQSLSDAAPAVRTFVKFAVKSLTEQKL